MKVFADNKELFTLTDTQKKVICNDILSEKLTEDLERRLQWVIMHKYNQCFDRLKAEWEPKLADRGVESIPTNKDAFADLVFSQPDYKDRSQREQEAKAVLQ